MSSLERDGEGEEGVEDGGLEVDQFLVLDFDANDFA
jgi:hypothetical protein